MDFDPLAPDLPRPVAVLALTANGTSVALRLGRELDACTVHVPRRHGFALAMGAEPFDRLRERVGVLWKGHGALVFVMATGIVVRCIAPLLRHKSCDPAVVVVDEKGRFVISLLSGHLGGANRLACRIAQVLGGQAVITTATDVEGKTAVDLMAREAGLEIEALEHLPRVTRAVLEDEPFWILDPDGWLNRYRDRFPRAVWVSVSREIFTSGKGPRQVGRILSDRLSALGMDPRDTPGIWVGEWLPPRGLLALCLRPRVLAVGIGCNRGTPAEEILQLVRDVFQQHRLSLQAIRTLASGDLKAHEPGLLESARVLDRPIQFVQRAELQTVEVPNPSPAVKAHIGVESVCEAAALQTARNGRLIVPKHKTRNVTVAVARDASPW
ncbi:cobalt-precorrin 5A acetaldehyde-lyase [Desulfacinum hydrothermale DSM 13146]|uniref:Cobalt-precorrin 5A acetaldehyde-lyase n=1 Tax=Desulfacinum hydrothermale DSM 13146 TaxID=1121390 RepID=A0A1W1WZ79_9BACT|nr:cobalt-precorrin 5A hydrolase [Desulfacinum hydrothermale]SMC16441.1 cobalt-precorrin 5A acetaldehyde-lyase [Desulfacinum hydrothermale DSM 13146]